MNVAEVAFSPAAAVQNGRTGQARATRVANAPQPPQDAGADEDAWAGKNAHDPAQDRKILTEAGQKLDEALESLGLTLKYRVDESTDRLQVEIIEPDTGKVLRKLPPDDLLKLARSVQEMARGFLDKMY